MKTKCMKEKLEVIKVKLKFDYCMVVESCGSSGGLALLWKHGLDVQIYNFTIWHISAIVKDTPSGNPQIFTGFYGHPETSKREWNWMLLKRLKDGILMPWLCMGDFNKIACQSEKVGASVRSYRQMEAFRDAIGYCGGLPFQGQNLLGPIKNKEGALPRRGQIELWQIQNGSRFFQILSVRFCLL